MTTSTIEIRIRHVDETKARHLMDWPPTDLDSAIPTIQAWGINAYGETYDAGLSGQFVLDDTGAYFEITIGDAEPTDA